MLTDKPMGFVLFLVFIFVLFVACCWFIWPIKTLWYYLGFYTHQRYTSSFHHVDYVPEDKPAIILSSHVNLRIAILLRMIAHQKIMLIMDNPSYKNIIIEKLLYKTSINIISSENLNIWDKKGLLLVPMESYSEITKFKLNIIPLLACGLEHIKFEKGKNVSKHILLNFFPPLFASLKSKERKMLLANYNIYAWEKYISLMPTIAEIWIKQAKAKRNEMVIADSTGIELTGYKLLAAVITMSKHLAYHFIEQERIGICLPPSAGGAMTMLCCLMQGKTMVNLNYTASPKTLQLAIKNAEITTIVTSGKFIEQLKNKGFYLEDLFASSKIVLLEDIKQQINKLSLLKNLIIVKLNSGSNIIKKHVTKVSIEHTAAILFSSGSEGQPKGIELSHKNIIANIKQSMLKFEPSSKDSIISILPIFHAFGLTTTSLLPLLEGVFVACHPDPTDGVAIGKLSQKYKLSIICGTSTFFRLYSKNKHVTPQMFSSFKRAVAGAERLLPEVRYMFEKKFKLKIIEGYGTTELSPVCSVNQVDLPGQKRNRIGTVGGQVAGLRVMIIDPETLEDIGIDKPGMITAGGVNVMKGYLNDPEKTDQVIFIQDKIRWYQTGDKGILDKDGYLKILDRYSRFAKLGGEMVSLFATETEIMKLIKDTVSDDDEILAVATPDIKKGEQISLLYNFNIAPQKLKTQVNSSNIFNLLKPSHYFYLKEIPKLGSGKTDFYQAKKITLEKLTS